MARIRPFCATRYTESAGEISQLVAPPYDVINSEDRVKLIEKSNLNVVQMTVPQQEENERSKFVKYARSKAFFEAWKREGFLKTDSKPMFYRYIQKFEAEGRQYSRTAFFTLLKAEPYEKGVVLPHEQTFPKHKEDRLRLLEATQAQLESIFGLYEDEDSSLHALIAKADGKKLASIKTDDGVEHLFEAIENDQDIELIVQKMEPKKIWIADGHHRFETACTYREKHSSPESDTGQDYMIIALSSMKDPGLALLPTHRIVNKLPEGTAKLCSLLGDDFDIQDCAPDNLVSELEKIGKKGECGFGAVLPGGDGMLLVAKDKNALMNQFGEGQSDELKNLDVSILHGYIFEKLLGIKNQNSVSYSRNAAEAIESVEQGAAVSFLMNAPSIEDMRKIALSGEKMPQKSTFYYPKLLSGLVMWSMNDF